MAEQGRGDYFIINTSILPGCLFPTEAWTKKTHKSKDIWKSLHQNKDGGNISRFSISVHFCGLFLSCASVIRMNDHFEALCILITEWKQTLLWQNWENAADTEAVTGKCEYSANSTCKLILKKENTQRQKKNAAPVAELNLPSIQACKQSADGWWRGRTPPSSPRVTRQLQERWRCLGVEVEVECDSAACMTAVVNVTIVQLR